MELYPVDVEAKQIVRWLMEEQRRPAFNLLVTATRSYQSDSHDNEASQLGDAEREDLREISEIGLLEVTPRDAGGWALRIRVEDDIGPGLPEDEPVPAGEEEIDLATFYADFIAQDRGLAEVSAEAKGAGGKAELARVLDAILKDNHQR